MFTPFIPAKQRTLRRPTRGPDVLLLHMLLNSHLGPPDDQLPITGPDADGFGPRTEAKVKRFQQANHIDAGTKYYMDGVVGPHTWEKLNERQKATVKIITIPMPEFKPPPPPTFTPSSPPPSVAIPAPKLHLDSVQVQAGVQQTIFLNGDPSSTSEQIQVVAVFLKKNDGFHVEGQVGGAFQANQGGGNSTDKADLGVLFVLNLANLPGSGNTFTWGVQDQALLWKSLTDRTGFVQDQVLLNANLSVLKRKDGNDLLQVNTYLGPLFEADSPDASAGKKSWNVRTGIVGTAGVTILF